MIGGAGATGGLGRWRSGRLTSCWTCQVRSSVPTDSRDAAVRYFLERPISPIGARSGGFDHTAAGLSTSAGFAAGSPKTTAARGAPMRKSIQTCGAGDSGDSPGGSLGFQDPLAGSSGLDPGPSDRERVRGFLIGWRTGACSNNPRLARGTSASRHVGERNTRPSAPPTLKSFAPSDFATLPIRNIRAACRRYLDEITLEFSACRFPRPSRRDVSGRVPGPRSVSRGRWP